MARLADHIPVARCRVWKEGLILINTRPRLAELVRSGIVTRCERVSISCEQLAVFSNENHFHVATAQQAERGMVASYVGADPCSFPRKGGDRKCRPEHTRPSPCERWRNVLRSNILRNAKKHPRDGASYHDAIEAVRVPKRTKHRGQFIFGEDGWSSP